MGLCNDYVCMLVCMKIYDRKGKVDPRKGYLGYNFLKNTLLKRKKNNKNHQNNDTNHRKNTN